MHTNPGGPSGPEAFARPSRTAASRGARALAIGAVAAGALAGVAAAPAHATALPGVTDTQRIERSVVQLETDYSAYVEYPDESGTLQRSAKPVTAAFGCTGWFVDSTGDIVTAGHCVDPEQADVKTAIIDEFLAEQGITDSDTITWAEQNLTLESASGSTKPDVMVWAYQSPDVDGAVLTDPNGTVVHVQAYKPFEQEDLALLNVVTKKATPALPVAGSDPQIGAQVTSIGFPGSISDVTVGTQEASFKTGSVSSRQVLPSGVARLEVNADIGAGMSGGPTIDSAGAVLGVNSGGIEGSGDFNFITDTRALRQFLTQQGVTPASAGHDTASTGHQRPSNGPAGAAHKKSAPQSTTQVTGMDGGLVVLLVAIGVAIVVVLGLAGLIVGLVVRSRKRRLPDPRTTEHAAGGMPVFEPVSPDPDRSAPATIVCPNGHRNPAGAAFCGACGEMLSPEGRTQPIPA